MIVNIGLSFCRIEGENEIEKISFIVLFCLYRSRIGERYIKVYSGKYIIIRRYYE